MCGGDSKIISSIDCQRTRCLHSRHDNYYCDGRVKRFKSRSLLSRSRLLRNRVPHSIIVCDVIIWGCVNNGCRVVVSSSGDNRKYRGRIRRVDKKCNFSFFVREKIVVGKKNFVLFEIVYSLIKFNPLYNFRCEALKKDDDAIRVYFFLLTMENNEIQFCIDYQYSYSL